VCLYYNIRKSLTYTILTDSISTTPPPFCPRSTHTHTQSQKSFDNILNQFHLPSACCFHNVSPVSKHLVYVSGDKAPRILNLDTRWSVITFIVDVDPARGCRHRVEVGRFADVSEKTTVPFMPRLKIRNY
jgi:hypothetical protein